MVLYPGCSVWDAGKSKDIGGRPPPWTEGSEAVKVGVGCCGTPKLTEGSAPIFGFEGGFIHDGGAGGSGLAVGAIGAGSDGCGGIGLTPKSG